MQKRLLLIAGAILMILLGLARGAGGLVLLTQGVAADPNIQASASAVSMVGAFLLLLAVVLVISAVGVLRHQPSFWVAGIVCIVAFVIDGAINGTVLYGRPGDQGTVVNLIVAVLILVCLLLGRGALQGDRDRPAVQ